MALATQIHSPLSKQVQTPPRAPLTARAVQYLMRLGFLTLRRRRACLHMKYERVHQRRNCRGYGLNTTG